MATQKIKLILFYKNGDFFALTSHAIETEALAELIGDDEENRLGVFQRLQKDRNQVSISICGGAINWKLIWNLLRVHFQIGALQSQAFVTKQFCTQSPKNNVFLFI